MIHGAGGGVGSFAVQLAHAHGAHVIATTSAQNAQLARELGADEVIDRSAASLEEALKTVDVVFDTAGGSRLRQSARLMRAGGRVVSIAATPADAPGDPDHLFRR